MEGGPSPWRHRDRVTCQVIAASRLGGPSVGASRGAGRPGRDWPYGPVTSVLVAERGGRLITDPLPHRDGPLHLRAGDQRLPVQLPGVEADRADVVATPRSLVPCRQVGQRRAAVARDTGGGAAQGQPDCLSGQRETLLADRLSSSDFVDWPRCRKTTRWCAIHSRTART